VQLTQTQQLSNLAINTVPFSLSNQVDLALAADADGVHIGQQDIPLPSLDSYSVPAPDWSLHNQPEEMHRAIQEGADYIGGPVYETPKKSKRQLA